MRRHDGERGQLLTVFVLSMLSLLLVVGLAVDGGYAWVKRRQAQNAADFAALAGARIIRLGKDNPALNNSHVADAIIRAAAANDGATVAGFGTAAGPYYTDGTGTSLSAVGPVANTSAIPSAATGVSVPNATVSWHPFVVGIIGINSWTAAANATARFAMGSSGPPCSLCVLSNVTSTNGVNVVTSGSVLVGGSLTGTNSATITSQNGSVVFGQSLNGTNNTHVSAPNGSVHVGLDLVAVNGTQVSAASGSVYVARDMRFTNGGSVSASGAVMAGRDLTMTNTGGTLIAVPTGSVSVGRNLSLTNATNPIQAQAIRYVNTFSQTNSSVNPTPTQIGSVTVPPAPAVSDPYTSLPDATTAKVQEVYPAYPSGLTSRSQSYVNSQTGTITPAANEIWTVNVTNSSGATLNPGIYRLISGVNCSASRTAFALNPGTYYFDNGSSDAVNLTNNCALVGNGPVTLVFLNDSGLNAVNGSVMQVQAPAATLSPSASYPWPGVAIFFARGNTSSLDLTNSSGSGTKAVVGIVYAPAATLVPVNAAGETVDGTIVVNNYTPTNASPLTVTDSGGGSALAPGPIQLVR